MKTLKYFIAGIFAALGALLLEVILDFFNYQFSFSNWALYSLVLFAIIEELAKLIVIQRTTLIFPPFRSAISGPFWIGSGFGLFELAILLLNDGPAYTGNILSITSVLLLHVLTAVLTGLLASRPALGGRYRPLAILPSLVLHLAFNSWVLMG